MAPENVCEPEVAVAAENIGGITSSTVTFSPGVTVLTGRNATNRTSFLQAIMGGLGSTRVSLKRDATEGEVQVDIGDETYTRTLSRTEDGLEYGGEPFLADATVADRFAFLLESNEARRAVELSQDLRDIIMQPVDERAIRSELRELREERDEIDSRIAELERTREQLPALTQRQTELAEEIDEHKQALARHREEFDALSADPEQAQAEESEFEQKVALLHEKQSTVETTKHRLESERNSLASLRDEEEEVTAEYAALDFEAFEGVAEIESEIRRLRERKQQVATELSTVQSIVQFNEEMLTGTRSDIAAALRDDEPDEAVTDRLFEGSQEVVCWTCGTAVDRERVEETLARLRTLRSETYEEQDEIEEQLTALKAQKERIQDRIEKRDRLERRLSEIRAEIEQREETVEELTADLEEASAAVDRLRAEIDELERQDRSAALETQKRVSQLEVELQQLEEERNRVQERIAEAESQAAEIDELADRREQVRDQLNELRTRVERTERRAVEKFNEQMDTVLDILDYENIGRIWVERVETTATEGRQTAEQTQFLLHIVRVSDDGVAYEDEIEHLSESERAVTGLVFALSGYLTHSVYEEVPFILLDSLEAIDADRIATLVEYVEEYAEYLVLALLPEDAEALSDEYEYVTTI